MDDKLIEEMARALHAHEWSGLRDPANFETDRDYWIEAAQACASILKKRIEGLEDALKPFAREADDWDDKMDCEDIPAEATDIKISDLRKARAALSPVGVTHDL
jgi:hypothetical protein